LSAPDGTARGKAELLGLRRGGPEPPATRAGQPLRPLTVPNFVGYARIVLVGVFLARTLPSNDGRDTLATICFGAAAASDYLDGLLARVTGQYSRLGALMDPFVDRLVVISGVVVTWQFELLPRWALALLAARELAMLLLVWVGLRYGLDIEINWVGRLAVWPTMMAFGATLIGLEDVGPICLYIGIAAALSASALYVHHAFVRLRERRLTPG
jgi:cardiolipin synthase